MKDNKHIDSDWKNELLHSNNRNLPLFIYGSVFGILIFVAFDYLAIPELWATFLVFRLICCTIGIFVLWLNRQHKITARSAVVIFIIAVYLFFSFGASLLNANYQLLTWNFSIIVAGLFWPYFIMTMPKRVNLLLSLFFAASYVSFYFLFSNFSIESLLTHGGVFFLFGLLASYIISYSKYKMHYNNFKLRYELSLSKGKLEVINHELDEANRVKNKLFSIISHDLRSPFNALIGFSDRLNSRISLTSDKELKKYASIINDGLNNTYIYLNNLLEWSRLQTDKIEFQPTVLNMTQLVEEVKELSFLQGQDKKITIHQRLPEKLEIFADRDMIKSILSNLISNAIKFSHEGADIEIFNRSSADHVELCIQDHGIGISKEAIEKLFKVEESFSTSGTNNEKGTGLGLVLSNEFAKKHGGHIAVKSTLGIGSVFSVHIPNNHKDD